MSDDRSPLAWVLRAADRASLANEQPASYWERMATAAREHLSPAPTERPTCATCPYWAGPEDAHGGLGSCRPRSPRHLGSQCDDFAIVSSIEWCGDHPDFPAYIASRRATT